MDREGRLKQSIEDILWTPIGSRTMRPTYGSSLCELLDAPVSPALISFMMAEIAHAVMRWEPEITIKTVQILQGAPGQFTTDISYFDKYKNSSFNIKGVSLNGHG